MRLLVFKLMAVLVLLTAWGSSAFGAASADIDGSGKVDFNDLAVMQKYWLGAGPVADIGGADGNSDGVVDGLDFAVLGGSWHTTTSEVIGPSILMRGYKYKGNLDERWERGVIWADYYFVEALMRYKAMTEP